MSEQFTMPRKLAHELLGALFNGPGLNPAGYEALKQDFAARLRAAPVSAASAILAAEPLLMAVNVIARQLMNEQADAPDDAEEEDVDEEDFAAGKMAGTVQFAAEMIKHIHQVAAGAPEPEPCWCAKCLDSGPGVVILGQRVPASATRMILCPTCGNKRCPRANDHGNACSGSNDPGQPGSAFATTTTTTERN